MESVKVMRKGQRETGEEERRRDGEREGRGGEEKERREITVPGNQSIAPSCQLLCGKPGSKQRELCAWLVLEVVVVSTELGSVGLCSLRTL